MEYTIIGLVVLASLVMGVIIFLKSKEKSTDIINNTGNTKEARNQVVQIANELQEYKINVELLPAEFLSNDMNLIEIKDSKVLAHINNLVPEFAQIGNAANNAVQAAQANGETLYRVILPAGAKLTKSKATEGAVRGFYHGKKGFKGHADWMPVETQTGTEIVSNTAAAAMGLASMVVGQYYMAQINAELTKISNDISKISDFQENEFRSRVFSLIAHVKKIADFQIEILDNDELRFSKISQLNNLDEECTKLLGQVNLALKGFTNDTSLNYASYEKELLKVQEWIMYQKQLLDVLYRISELLYTLHKGAVSREYCIYMLPTYTDQVKETQDCLIRWHKATAERLGIDISEARRKRLGFDGVVHFLPGLINDDLNYKSIGKDTAKMIRIQSTRNASVYDTSNLYEEDVHLIYKDGKTFYMLTEK